MRIFGFSWRFLKERKAKAATTALAGWVLLYLMIFGDDAGADGTTAFTDGETQTFFHGDRASSLTVIDTLSPGSTISFVRRQVDRAGHVRRAEVELRTIAVEERRGRPPSSSDRMYTSAVKSVCG